MSRGVNDVNVQCPFYLYDDGRNQICCEGLVKGSNLTQRYRKRCDMRQQMDIFCCDYYKNCEVYRMLMEAKY